MSNNCGIRTSSSSRKSSHYVPADKKHDAQWVASLLAKGERKAYAREELKHLAMPCGGIGAGQIEITGEGTLGTWLIFSEPQGNGYNGAHYLKPEVAAKRVEHGFAVRIEEKDKPAEVLQLSRKDFDDLRFIGEYPIATLEYRKAGGALPVKIQSEIFSPFVPLSVRDSANPVTVFRFTVTATASNPLTITLAGWLQNATFPAEQENRNNRVVRGTGLTGVLLGTTSLPQAASSPTAGTVARGDGRAQYGDLALSVLDDQASASVDWVSIEKSLPDMLEKGFLGAEQKQFPVKGTAYGSVASTIRLEPGETKTITFLFSWYFPNLYNRDPGCPGLVGRIYDRWYDNSFQAAQYVASNLERLHGATVLFRDTFFDTTLPYWLVQRIGMPASTLACDNINIWENGRLYGYEGVGFCFGTCGHVYNFVTAVSRLFPELERGVRLMQDLGPGFDPDSGRVNFRGHDGPNPTAEHAYASDAQSGYVLKIYREHLMSSDHHFLNRVWPNVKRMIGYQIFRDGAGRGLEPNGVLEALQTFWDPEWYGPNPYNNTLYLAALRAAEEMALIQGETKLARQYHALYESGRKYMDERMWNGEYYVHLYPEGFGRVEGNGANCVVSPELERRHAKDYVDQFNEGRPHYYVSTACDANQLFGQNWANQLGLGYILPPDRCRTAAYSIFLYNWTPDISTVYSLYPPKNRTLAAPGEGAMVNGSWPKLERQPFENIHDKEDVWTGLEYEAACDMLNEGLLQEGLTVIRAIHDRYDGTKRNPWNEIEGWDHYSRAMHAWNILLALSGYTHDGPAGKIGFAPRMTPENFRCFFSACEGWGSFAQECEGRAQNARIAVKFGRLRLKEISLAAASGKTPEGVMAMLDSQSLASSFEFKDGKALLRLAEPVLIPAGKELRIEMRR